MAAIRPASRSSRHRPAIVDVLIGILAVAGNIGVALAEAPEPGHRDLDAWAVVIMGVTGLSLAWTRRAPLAVLAATVGAIFAYDVSDYTGGPIYVAPLMPLYALAARDGRRAAVRPAAAATVVIFTPWLIWPSGDPVAIHFVYVTWVVAAVLLGDAARNRRLYVAGVEERARYLEESGEEEARRRVVEERLRIARDLHDSVAHSLASISVQAGAGAHVGPRRPDDAVAALVAIRQASVEALGELRSTLGLLRSDPADGPDPATPAPTAPLPTGLRIESLIAGVQAAGLPVELVASGHPGPGTDGPAGEAAYRIVQEALTNTLRHAGPSRARVTLRYGPDAVDVEITDDGLGPGAAGAAPGHGLVGMRERAEALGGSVTAAPGTGGGFIVRAHLPFEGDHARSGAAGPEVSGAERRPR